MSLSKQLLSKQARPAVVKDLVEVVREEVRSKKGVSGTAIKAGYAGATKVMPDLVRRAVRKLLPDFARALDPFWNDFVGAGGQDFGQYLASRGSEASAALLAVTDAKLESSSRDQLKKVYRALRGKADGHVQAALPRLGATLQRHAATA